MKPDSGNFGRLRRLLALKRHEQPPPGYFHSFSSQVISRIQAGERGEPDSMFKRFLEGLPGLLRFRDILEAKPAFAGAFGAAVCALLLSVIIYSENGESIPVTPLLAAETSSSFDGPSPLALNDSPDRAQLTSSTNAVAPAVGSLFSQLDLIAEPVSFVFPGGN